MPHRGRTEHLKEVAARRAVLPRLTRNCRPADRRFTGNNPDHGLEHRIPKKEGFPSFFDGSLSGVRCDAPRTRPVVRHAWELPFARPQTGRDSA